MGRGGEGLGSEGGEVGKPLSSPTEEKQTMICLSETCCMCLPAYVRVFIF